MAGYPDANPRRTFSLRHVMVAMVGIALVFWLMFARDDETILLAISGYLTFAVICLVVMPMFLFRRTCPQCGARAMFCMGVILLRPPLGSYFCCMQCWAQFQRQPFKAWIPRDRLPARMFPPKLGSSVIDPLVWLTDPQPLVAEISPILHFEDPET